VREEEQMASLPTRILLFLSSYAPLFAILTLLTHKDFGRWSFGFVGLGIFAVLILILYLTVAKRLTSYTITADTVGSRNSDSMSYIASYLIPFLGLPWHEWRNAVSMGVFFLMLGVVYVNTNMIYINPMLNLLLFHIYEVESDGSSYTVLSRKHHIFRGSKITVTKLGEGVLLETKND
jgi:hypothetical protein